jgi:hypothetical protein
MANVEHASEPSVTSLVTGVLNDAQELFKQQLALFRSELRQDLTRTRDAVLSLAIGAGILMVGGLLLCFAIVYFLNWAFPSLPLWGSFAIVGGLFVIAGGGLVFAGVRKFQSFNPLPDQSVGALKENVQWIMNPK